MAATACSSRTCHGVSPIFSSSSSTTFKAQGPVSFLPCPNSFRPNFPSNPTLKSSSLKISHSTKKSSKHVFRVPIIFCLVEDDSEAYPESEQSSVHRGSPRDAAINIKLPRRSLLVHFTCNACGTRCQKLINRLAYEQGTVFVQCSGCFQHHKLVDNLGLVVEYDFREEIGVDSNADQN
ncbi:unnamed protein product [Ilex paraguariensis]|uniref:DNL-type domain-containing protein n=1 Tax=Ilex paraguariensis TaxID=185542 RepID=A0ABC8SJF9_9AQUA